MVNNSSDVCICGHRRDRHFIDVPRCVGGDAGCWLSSPKSWHEFKLDNLLYLEKLSEKKRNLPKR